MKEFEKIESLLKSKSYDVLTHMERQLVDQELSQEVYEELRLGMNQLKGERLKVPKTVHQSLMAEFKQQESSAWSGLFSRKVPAYSLLVPLVLLIGIILFLPEREVAVVNDRIVEVMVRDTIQVTRVDTLWRERLVQVPKLVYVTKDVTPERTVELPATKRSLGDQKELMDLVVRSE